MAGIGIAFKGLGALTKKFGSKSCPPGSKRYNLAKTFKKMGRERKAKG